MKTQIIRILAAFGAASQFKGASAPWADRILQAALAVLGVPAMELSRLEAAKFVVPKLAAMVSFGPTLADYRLNREAAEIARQTSTDFWLRAACQSAIWVLWQDAAKEMLDGTGAEAVDEMIGSQRLIDRVLSDVAMIDAMFDGVLKLDAAQDADFRPVFDLDAHLNQVAQDVIKYRREAAIRRESRGTVTPKPAVQVPVAPKRSWFGNVWAALCGR